MSNNWGIQNHNPGNLEANQPWEGMIGSAGPRNRFGVFKSNVWGFRAMFRNYISYYDKGINTITKIVNTWSPAADNIGPGDPDGTKNVAAYIQALCSATKFEPDDVISMKSWENASRLVYAQTIHECGQFSPAFTQAEMAEGAYRAGITDAPAPTATAIARRVGGYGSAVAGAAAVAQPAIETMAQQPHSHSLQIALGAAAIVLGIIAAVVKPKVGS